jgi:quercetin dioxygenase-like cupin family protein
LKASILQKKDYYLEGKQETDNYIGKVFVNRVSDCLGSEDLKTYFVTFYDGARTRLHYHDSEQVLIAHEGEGFVTVIDKIQEKEDQTFELISEYSVNIKPGESVMIPAEKLHWHGAKYDSKKFSHISILKNGNTVWL